MRYTLVRYPDERLWSTMPEARRRAIARDLDEIIEVLVESGHFRVAVRPEPTPAATRARDTGEAQPDATPIERRAELEPAARLTRGQRESGAGSSDPW